MRDLIISAVVVLVLITGWLIFDNYSQDAVEEMSSYIMEDILPVVESESWKKGIEMTEKLDKDWHRYKKIALFFLETDAINDIDYALAKSVEYVKAEDVSNSTGELKSMSEQLSFLGSQEKITLPNIF